MDAYPKPTSWDYCGSLSLIPARDLKLLDQAIGVPNGKVPYVRAHFLVGLVYARLMLLEGIEGNGRLEGVQPTTDKQLIRKV